MKSFCLTPPLHRGKMLIFNNVLKQEMNCFAIREDMQWRYFKMHSSQTGLQFAYPAGIWCTRELNEQNCTYSRRLQIGVGTKSVISRAETAHEKWRGKKSECMGAMLGIDHEGTYNYRDHNIIKTL